VTIEPEATLAKAARLIHEEKVKRLPSSTRTTG
jgi:hypothetical protein